MHYTRPGRASSSRRLPQNLPPVVSPSRCPARPACRDISHGRKKRCKQAYRHCTACWKPGRRARFGGGTELAGCQALHWARQLQSRPAHLQLVHDRQHLNLTPRGVAHATLGGAPKPAARMPAVAPSERSFLDTPWCVRSLQASTRPLHAPSEVSLCSRILCSCCSSMQSTTECTERTCWHLNS